MRFLIIVQVIVALLLIVSILLQSRGSGMSVSVGGNYYAKRGFEKFLLYASTGLAILFILLAGVNTWLSQQI